MHCILIRCASVYFTLVFDMELINHKWSTFMCQFCGEFSRMFVEGFYVILGVFGNFMCHVVKIRIWIVMVGKISTHLLDC